ncbi:MAG: hypothetical protein EBT00_16245, partial [Proteobacteria bacterium]|nr:hypothetical protein [Pseudomonadota bacterium]
MAPDVPDEVAGGVLDTFEPGVYDPGLYVANRVIVPISGHDAWDANSEGHLEAYETEGFVSIAGFFTTAEVGDALDGMVT